MTTADHPQIIVEEVVRTRAGLVENRFVTLVPADQAASMLARQMADDVLEELDAQGLGQDLQALAENAGDERQDFHVYTRDELRYAGLDMERHVHPDVWNVAAEAGWLIDNGSVAGGEMEVSK